MGSTKALPLLAPLVLVMAGCLDTDSDAESSSEAVVEPTSRSTVSVAFDPANQVIPFPNNLLFEAGAQSAGDLDGTLNVPNANGNAGASSIINALNDLDGFSTHSAWRVGFTGPIDTATVDKALRVFRMETQRSRYPERVRPEGIDTELKKDRDYRLDFDPQSQVLTITPLKPLGHDSTYTVVITRELLDPQGRPISAPLQWSLARGSSQLAHCDAPDKPDRATLQCMTRFAIDPVIAGTALEKDDLIMGWGVTTQRRDTTFNNLARLITTELEEAISGDGDFDPRQLTTFFDAGSAELPESLPVFQQLRGLAGSGEPGPRTPGGAARVWPGVIHLPSWLDQPQDISEHVAAAEGDPEPIAAPSLLDAHWQCEGSSCNADEVVHAETPSRPRLRHMQDLPIILATPDPEHDEVPAEDEFDNGYPVVIFLHALQQDRTNALALADALAREGYAALGIDMPLHGVVPHMLDPLDESTTGRIALYAPALNDAADEAEQRFGRRPLPVHYERHFFLNRVNESEYARGFDPEDYPEEQRPYLNPAVDPSGRHFLRPENPLSQRDTLRQGGLDLVALAHYLRNGWFHQTCLLETNSGTLSDPGIFGDGDSLALLDERLLQDQALIDNCTANLRERLDFSRLHFASHSASNVVAAPFLAWDQDIITASHLLPMAGIMRSLEASETIGPIFREQLAENGLSLGDEDYFRFMVSVQAALDAVEPLNLASGAAPDQRPVYVSRIPGNSGTQPNPPDLILPVEISGHPLAGSNALVRQMGLSFRPNALDDTSGSTVTLTASNEDGTPAPLQTSIGFRFGSHASPLLPVTEDSDPRPPDPDATFAIPNGIAVHKEMQRQLARFIASEGMVIDRVESDLVRSRD